MLIMYFPPSLTGTNALNAGVTTNMTWNDHCIDCGAKVEVTGHMILDSIPDRCIFCTLTLGRNCVQNWLEYYMVASGLLQMRVKP